jgi:transcription initiation factor TFIIB
MLRDIHMSKRRAQTVNELVCSECGSSNIIHDGDSGEIICGTCGLVITDSVINKGPEWRAFTQTEKESRSRVGVPLSFSVHDKGLTTMIGRVGRDAFGRKIPLKTKLQMLRLRKWQIRSRVHSSVDRNLAQAMAELDRLTDKLHIPPSIKEKAAVIYRKALDKGLVRGRSISAIAAASLYAACRTSPGPSGSSRSTAPSKRRTSPGATGSSSGSSTSGCPSPRPSSESPRSPLR